VVDALGLAILLAIPISLVSSFAFVLIFELS